MSDSPSLSTLSLPQGLEAEDLIGLRDEMAARIQAVVVQPKGNKKTPKPDELPPGLSPISELPPQLALPWKRFDTATTDLVTFRRTRASAQADVAFSAADETEQSAANTGADDKWRAYERWLSGAAGLADDGESPSPAEARWLYAQLFPPPDGLRFITRRPRVQWTEMEHRMEVLASDRAKAVIEGFGGSRHYGQLQAGHERFGKAFGFTKAVVTPEAGPTDGRPQWLTARDALRTLVQKIEAWADPELDGSVALSSYLLGPYLKMVSDFEKATKGRGKKTPAAPEPAETP